MLGCVRRRSCGDGCTRGGPCSAMGSLAAILLFVGVVAWPTGDDLRAQDRTPAGDPPGVAPSPPATAPQPPDAPPPVAPQPRPPRPAPAAEPQTVQVFGNPVAQIRPPRRFQFTIAPNLPVKDLMPVPPVVKTGDGRVPPKTLADVPEADFQVPLAKTLGSEEAQKQTAHTIAKVNHLNAKKTDAFMDALRGARPDLSGLPFMMGDDCRIKGDRSRELTRAVNTVRNALRQQAGVVSGSVVTAQFVADVNAPPAQPALPAIPVPPALPASAPVPAPTPPAPAPQAVNEAPPAPAPATPVNFTFTTAVPAERANPTRFWEQYAAACAQEDKQTFLVDRAQQENVLLARVAALMQVLAPEAPAMRLGLVKYLAAVSHAEATRALARLAVFSEEDEVRLAAIAALKVRRERDYTDILLGSLRYPWPAVARRGADALARLERTDLVPQLVELLDEPDPRAPVVKTANGRRVHEARELVRINHHRNCLLCHAPGNTPNVSPDTLTASVPVPSDPLPAPADGYQTTSPDLSVRIDVTYLRPDFSMLQAVADANPWPEMQRFDFLVRTRELTEQEAVATREALATGEPGRPSPYHRAVLVALRELTGRDTAPTAEAWRRLLNLPAPPRQAALAP
jgi:hypothetical protein